MKLVNVVLLSVAMSCPAIAQPPGGRGERGRGGGPRGSEGGPGAERPRGFDRGRGDAPSVDRVMAMDANGDGKLSADEVTDARLKPMLDRADANQDGVVTKEELTAMVGQRGGGEDGRQRRGFGGDRGPRGEFGGDGPPGRGMRGGPGQFGPPPVGQILPPFVQDDLALTESQRVAIAKLQAKVDAQLAKILTAEQQQQLRQGPGAGPRGGGPRDGGPRDGGPRDGGPRDGGPRDGGPRDGGPRDGGPQGPGRGQDRPPLER